MKVLDKKFFRELAPNVVNLYRKHTFDKAKDIKDKKFKPYLNPQDPNSYGQRKRAGGLERQALQFKNTTAPVASGDLYRDFKLIKVKSSGFSFGTVTEGGKVEALKKIGRVMYTSKDPVPSHIDDFVEKEVAEYADKQLGKIKMKDINLDIKG